MRKLKTFITQSGFFELAITTTSMKAAIKAWGVSPDAFKRGWAKQTQNAGIVAATMAKPGVVFCRAVGTKGKFTQHPKLPKIKISKKLPYKKFLTKENAVNKKNGRDKAKQEKHAEDKERRKELQRKKAAKIFERAEKRHEAALKRLQDESERLDKCRQKEGARWDEERERLTERL